MREAIMARRPDTDRRGNPAERPQLEAESERLSQRGCEFENKEAAA